jgi:hypothetical protein
MEKAITEQKALEKKIRLLEEEKKRATQELWIARRATAYYEKNDTDGTKKNVHSRKLLREIFSEVPKKPLKMEGT